MKASQVLEKYQNGERNFQGLNLRGENFAGKNLSRADFSHCQIQGTNFKGANLTGANFTGVKAGLLYWQIVVNIIIICSWGAYIQSVLFRFFQFLYISSFGQRINLGIILILLTITLACHLFVFMFYSFKEEAIKEEEIHFWWLAIMLLCVSLWVFSYGITEYLTGDIGFFAVLLFINLASTSIFAVCISALLSIVGSISSINILIISILLLITSGWSFWQGYLSSQESSFKVLIIGFCIFTTDLILGNYMSWCIFQKGIKKDTWVKYNAITVAAIGGTSFYNATLIDVNFTGANLKNTNFDQAILTHTCFKDTIKLNLARTGNTILANPKVRDLLTNPSNGYHIDLHKADLRGANLESANLQEANLSQADISEATLKYANLRDINLTEVNAVKTNFSDALLTGACLENWNIDATTILENMDCQYVYLLNDQKERRPSSGDFQGDEFAKLFEEVFDTVDLIFRDGIDWKAFLSAMKEVQVESEKTALEVQSIEKKGDGVFVVKVHVPPDSKKETIHQQLVKKYETEKKALEAEYKKKLAVQNKEIESYQRENTNLMKIIEMQAANSRPTNIINNTNQSHSGKGDNVGNDRNEHNIS